MKRFILALSIIIFSAAASAEYMCWNPPPQPGPGGQTLPCAPGQGPDNGWVLCNDTPGSAYCPPDNGAKKKVHKGTNNTAIALYVVGGAVFVGAMWYLFRTPKSDHFDNQVKLAAF